MAFNAPLLALLLALVLGEEELNMTLFGSELFDLNLTLTEGNSSWPPLGGASALVGTTSLPPSTTTIRPALFSIRPPLRIPAVPHYHHGPRYGPYFEDGVEHVNITARVGSTVRFDCKIGMLQDKTVTWLHRKADSIHLLTVGRQAYSSDQRITLSFRYPNNWRLEILYVTRRDAGLYECQVATHPPRVKTVFLKVTVERKRGPEGPNSAGAPEVIIMDEKSQETSERYYKAGSAVELTCLARHIEPPADKVEWRLGTTTLSNGIIYNKSLGENTVMATLTIPQGQKGNSGNYCCAVGSLASAFVAVHILNGELPAAVHGNGVSPGAYPSLWFLLIVLALALMAR